MTVGEMIAELGKLPRDIPVKVEGYTPDGPDGPGEGAVMSFGGTLAKTSRPTPMAGHRSSPYWHAITSIVVDNT